MIAYLVDDTRWLVPLVEVLRARVQEAGIAEEVQLECEYLLSRAAQDPPDPRPPWVRIKGAAELGAEGVAVLRELARVREEAAERLDVPPFKVVGNDVLFEIAERRPGTVADIDAIGGVRRGRARGLRRELLEGVKRGLEAGAALPEEMALLSKPAPPPAERAMRRRRQQALGHFPDPRGERAGRRPAGRAFGSLPRRTWRRRARRVSTTCARWRAWARCVSSATARRCSRRSRVSTSAERAGVGRLQPPARSDELGGRLDVLGALRGEPGRIDAAAA